MLFVGDDYGTTHPLDCAKYYLDRQPITLLQFTGIKDKNGIEVYEGDIVELTSTDGYVQENYELVEDMCEFWHNFNRDDPYYRMRECRVVGNVYENPELLK